MELSKIDKLLERYENGRTSLAEEKSLREYFLNGDVPPHLRPYQLMFLYSAKEGKESLQEKPQLQSKNKSFAWASVAAILIIALGIFFYNDSSRMLNENDLGTISDQELALEKTKETLNMVSQFMNEGTADLVYLKEFNNTKNKIIQID